MKIESVNNLEKMIQRTRRNTLGDLLTRTVARYPDKLAFVYRDRQVTYRELDELVNKTANGLRNRGIKKGDRLAIFSKNSLDFVIVEFALARLGAVLIPINFMLRGNDISYILDHAEAIGIFTEEPLIETIENAISELNIPHRFVLECESDISNTNWKSVRDLQKDSSAEMVEETIEDDDLVHILYTSGTESNPKGVMLSHKSIISEYVSCVIEGNMSPDDVLVHALPFYHSAQLHVFLGPSIYLGASVSWNY